MQRPQPLVLALLSALVLCSCSGGGAEAVRGSVVLPGGEVPTDAEAFLAASLEELAARPEHRDAEVEVRHILIGVGGAGLPGVTRSLEEARAEAAGLLQRLAAGEEMQALVTGYSDDPPKPENPGVYRMVLEGRGNPPSLIPRQSMVAAFGDVGWRLQVGEIGVAAHDRSASPYGYHIIKRLK